MIIRRDTEREQEGGKKLKEKINPQESTEPKHAKMPQIFERRVNSFCDTSILTLIFVNLQSTLPTISNKDQIILKITK